MIVQAESEKSDNLFLYIDLPKFDFPVVFSEPVSLVLSLLHVLKLTRRLVQEYPLPVLSSLTHSSLVGPSLTPSNVTGTTTPSTLNPSSSTSAAQAQAEANLFSIVDPEIVRKNPVEAKHRRLVRDHRNGPLDRELKPNAKIRDELNVRYYLFILSSKSRLILFRCLGHPALSTYSRPLNTPTRSPLEIPILPHTGQTSPNEIPQSCRLV